MKYDCLILGYYDFSFDRYLEMTRSMGADTGAFRDVNLAFVEVDQKPYRALDIFSEFYNQNNPDKDPVNYHNMDFLWPTVSYLGTFLHRHDFTFDYVNLVHLEMDKLREKLLTNDYLTVAVTTTLYVYPQPILEMISFIRKHNQKVKVLVGGPYVGNQTQGADTTFLQGFFRQMNADIYVDSSEGEQALLHVLRALKANSDLNNVKNIAYKKGEDYIITAKETESNPLEENQVNYSLFPKHEFDQFVSLRTAKSCPFSCAFCGFPSRAGAYKYLSLELVENELNQLRDLGVVTTITFLDDTFNVPKKRFKEMLRMMIRNDYGFKWNAFYRSDHGDPETIDLMRQAGCEGVFLGMESGSDRILKEMNKTARQKNYREAIPLLREAGIASHASLVIGFPGETYDTFMETHDFINEIKPDTFRAQLWYADPVTPVWKRCEELKIQGSAFKWSHHTMDCYTAMELVEHMFLSIENSVWLPQNGFEQWSLFYMQRHGMSLEDMKVYLNSFNQLIKDKLVRPGGREPLPHLVENLKHNSRMSDLTKFPDTWCATDYRAAIGFWSEHFSGLEGQSGNPTDTEPLETVEHRLEKGPLDQLAQASGGKVADVLLAVYATLLGRVRGVDDVVLITELGGVLDVVAPLRLQPDLDMGFDGWSAKIREQIEAARPHAPYALRVVPNSVIMDMKDAPSPSLDTAFIYRTEGGAENCLWPQELWAAHSSRLLVLPQQDHYQLAFSYGGELFSSEVASSLMGYLATMIGQLASATATPLGEIQFDAGGDSDFEESVQDDLETFSF